MQTAPDQSRPSSPLRQSGAASTAPRLALLAALALAACAPQTPPALSMSDDATAAAAPDKSATIREATDRALDRVKPEPRPEVR